jgi:hypothetical protein
MDEHEGAAGAKRYETRVTEDFLLEPMGRQLDAAGPLDQARIVHSYRLTTCRDLVLTQSDPGDDETRTHVFKIPEEGDLDVYGDLVRIVGPVTKPGCKLRIFCRRLELHPGRDGRSLVIDVSGEPGADHAGDAVVPLDTAIAKLPRAEDGKGGKGYSEETSKETSSAFAGSDGKDGGNGEPGGVIVIRAQILQARGDARLLANGGRGGSGGHGGHGGHGQDGGTCTTKHPDGLAGGHGGPGGRGGNGGSGGHGGTIYVDIVQCEAKRISLHANGGDGGDCGRGGNGGNGGNGSDGHAPTQVFPRWFGHNGGAAGNGGTAGIGQLGGSGGRAGSVVWRSVPVTDDAVSNRGGKASFTPGTALGNPGTAGRAGVGSQTLKSGFRVRKGHEDILGRDGNEGVPGKIPDHLHHESGADFQGERGVQIVEPARASPAGLIGPIPQGFIGVIQPQRSIIDHLRMLLEHAGLVHLMSDVSKDNAWHIERYGWLVALAGGIEGKWPDNTGTLRDEAAALARLAETAFDRVRRRRDYFGRSYRHVSLHSVRTLHDTLSQSILSYKDLERELDRDSTAFLDVKRILGDRALLEAAYEGEIGRLDENASEIKSRMKRAVAEIEQRQIHRGRQQDRLLETLKQFSEEFSTVFFELEPERVLQAIGQLAFVDTPGMGAMLGGAAIGEVVGDIRQSARVGLKSDSGEFYEEKWLRSKVAAVGRGLHAVSMADGFRAGLDGYISRGDPDGYRLLTTQQEFDALCEEFYASSDGARAAKQAMDDFVAAVQMRNSAIEYYNSLVTALTEVVNQRRHNVAERVQIQQSQAEEGVLSLNLACVVAGVARRRRRSLERIVEELYHAGRAVMAWKLAPFDIFAQEDMNIGFDSVRIGALQEKMIHLLGEFSNAMDEPHKYVPRWSSNWLGSDQPGVQIHFDDDEIALDRLLAGEEVQLWVSPQMDDGIGSSAPFYGMYGCRMLELRAWLETDRPVSESVLFEIRHSGDEEFVNRVGDYFPMQHDPVEDVFEYHGLSPRPKHGEPFRAEIKRNWGPWLQNHADWARIAPIGPFTHWVLRLPRERNAALMKVLHRKRGPKVTGLTLEFRCLYATKDLQGRES